MPRTFAAQARAVTPVLVPILVLIAILLSFWATRDVRPTVALGQSGIVEPEPPKAPAAAGALPAPAPAPNPPAAVVDQAAADRLASALTRSLPPGFSTDEARVNTGPDGVPAIGTNFRHPSGALISVLTVVPGPEGVAATVAAAKGSGAREVAIPGGGQGFLTSAGKYPDEWHNQLLVVDGGTTIINVSSVGLGAGKGAPPLNDAQLTEFAGRAVEASRL